MYTHTTLLTVFAILALNNFRIQAFILEPKIDIDIRWRDENVDIPKNDLLKPTSLIENYGFDDSWPSSRASKASKPSVYVHGSYYLTTVQPDHSRSATNSTKKLHALGVDGRLNWRKHVASCYRTDLSNLKHCLTEHLSLYDISADRRQPLHLLPPLRLVINAISYQSTHNPSSYAVNQQAFTHLKKCYRNVPDDCFSSTQLSNILLPADKHQSDLAAFLLTSAEFMFKDENHLAAFRCFGRVDNGAVIRLLTSSQTKTNTNKNCSTFWKHINQALAGYERDCSSSTSISGDRMLDYVQTVVKRTRQGQKCATSHEMLY